MIMGVAGDATLHCAASASWGLQESAPPCRGSLHTTLQTCTCDGTDATASRSQLVDLAVGGQTFRRV